jgi:proteasome accessory factor A
VFLENGARLYLDVGSHPEYATPECDSLYDLVAHDRAGERILEGLLHSAEQRLDEEGIRGQIYLFKNNTDSAGNSYGCHENYLVGRQGDFGRIIDTLIPFFVTRQIFAGAGKLLYTARGTVFCLAQRAEHIWEGVSSATTSRTPTPSGTAACTSSPATRTCPSTSPTSRWAPRRRCCRCSRTRWCSAT